MNIKDLELVIPTEDAIEIFKMADAQWVRLLDCNWGIFNK